jgi:hypothetical protein
MYRYTTGALACWGCNDHGEVGPLPSITGAWIAGRGLHSFTYRASTKLFYLLLPLT